MARIPMPSSGVSARSLRTNVGGPNTVADADAFGGSVARALGQVGNMLQSEGAQWDAVQDRKSKEDASNLVATKDFTREALTAQESAPADGAGLQDETLKRFDAWVFNETKDITDDKVRKEAVDRLNAQRPNWSARSVTQEFQLKATNAKLGADTAIDALNNKIAADPDMYEAYKQQGLDVLENSSAIPAGLRQGVKQQWIQNSAKARFNGMLEKATSVQDVDAIANELVGPAGKDGKTKDDFQGKDWAKEFAPEDYERLVNSLGATRKAIATKDDVDARAALDTIEDRANDVTASIPVDELKAVQQLVQRSANPVTLARLARVSRNEDVKKQLKSATPGEIQAQINGASGNPGVAYPGVPPRVSNAINKASEAFGVSPSYLGATTMREYGQYFRRARPQTNKNFTPVGTRKDVDLRNVRPDVLDALTVAGESFGAPLPINSGYRSQKKQDGIRFSGDPNRSGVAKESYHTGQGGGAEGVDISTVGMSAEQKGRLTASLADAGFTGFGEYDTHIHADMRGAVPASFGKDGSAWGGWTNLSPEVMNGLKARGFAAGLSSGQIKRATPVQTVDDVDYGLGTSMTRDDGRPTTSVVGVMQFTRGTFLETMRKPGVAQTIGVDISGMSDEQILELRKNPDVSIMAGAALAAENKKAGEAALGRSVSDPELYMLHFLGQGGGIALIRGNENQGNQSAAALLPEAAASNRPVFYDGKRAKTVSEVYNDIVRTQTSAPSQVAYGDNEMRKKVLTTRTQNLKDDPVTEAANTGTYSVTPVTQDGGFEQRGQVARQIADYYSIPSQDMKPFTADETTALAKSLESGDADKVLEVLSAVQSMGGDMARAGLKQLGETNATYAYAAGLQMETGSAVAAGDIVRGEKRLKENENLKSSIGADPNALSDAFNKTTGAALMQILPRERQSIQDAATAHYVETYVARGGGNGFSQEAYANSVQAVLGGRKGQTVLDTVNGEPTMLPKGVTGDQMETALDRMTVEDWTRLSPQKTAPLYADGTVIDPMDLADEAKLRVIGNGKYKVQLSDGSFAVTGQKLAGGRQEAYIFAPDAKSIQSVVERPYDSGAVTLPQLNIETGVNIPPVARSASEAAKEGPVPNFSVLSQFDENGLWVGPPKK